MLVFLFLQLGTGTVTVNMNPNTGAARVIMRRDGVKKLMLNYLLTPTSLPTLFKNKSLMIVGKALPKYKAKVGIYVLRLKSAEVAEALLLAMTSNTPPRDAAASTTS